MWLASGIQKIGIRNPDDWNPEFKRLESGLQRVGIWNPTDLRGLCYMRRFLGVCDHV